MKSHICILEIIKPQKMILDSAMASKMKNIDPKKTSQFNPKDGFHPKKIPWSLGGTKPFRHTNPRCLTFIGQMASHLDAVVKTIKISKALQATRGGPSDCMVPVWHIEQLQSSYSM